jgi:hypothetical protein
MSSDSSDLFPEQKRLSQRLEEEQAIRECVLMVDTALFNPYMYTYPSDACNT